MPRHIFECLTYKSDSNSEPDSGLHTSLYGAKAVPPHLKKKKNVPCECATQKKKKR